MKCPNCGTEMNNMEKVCSACNTPLDGNAASGNAAEAGTGQQEAAAEAKFGDVLASAAGSAAPEAGKSVEPDGQPGPGESAQPDGRPEPEKSAQPDGQPGPGESAGAIEDSGAAPSADPRPYIPADPPAQSPKKTGKVVAAAVAAVAVIGVGAFGVSRMMAKDPKEVVVDAFKNVYSKDQTNPAEDIFGFTELAELSRSGNVEASMSLVLDDCSEAQVEQYKGLGLTVDEKFDRENKKFVVDIGAIYNHMDLVHMNMYYGDDTLMVAVPELVDEVFVADLGDGLAERVKNSPTLGPVMEQQGVDVEGLMDYVKEVMEMAQNEQSNDPYGIQAALNRYKEGCKAQENFKAALTVEKAGKGQYQMDGQQVSCQGYQVHISKDSVIEFLRTSSDFFLQDEELKEAYLKNLRTGTRLLELMGTEGALSAEETQQEVYDSISEQAEEMISQLDKGMQDVDMTVYVDKKGRLAALEGVTILVQEDGNQVPVRFSVNLEGGTYLTQNAQAAVRLELPDEPLELKLEKSGIYDSRQLTCAYRLVCNETEVRLESEYTVEGGDYRIYGNVAMEGEDQGSLELQGIVDKLEKGKSIHLDMDVIRLEVAAVPFDLTMSGEYYIGSMTGVVQEPQGQPMDVFEATEEEWQAVMMRAFFSLMGIMGQIG